MPRNTCISNIAGTKTFRLASHGIETNFVQHIVKGCNLQNIEKNVRKIYKADAGKKLIQRDQSGAEALIVAYLCRNGNYRSLFLNGIKPHVYMALNLFPHVWEQKMQDGRDTKIDINEILTLPISELKLHPQWRELDKLIKSSDNWSSGERYYYIGKKVIHAASYGMRKNTFITALLEESRGTVVLTPQNGDKYLETFHSIFPEIREWHSVIEQQCHTAGILYNLFGFPFNITEQVTASNLKDYIAFIPQSTVATISNIAFTDIQRQVEENNLPYDLLAQTHDSIMCQCPDSEVAECNRIMKIALEQKLKSPRGEEFQMKSEGAAGKNWAPFKEGKNEDGLVTLTD